MVESDSAAMYTLLLTFKGGAKGGAVYDDAAAAEHTDTGRRASGVDGGSGAREAAAAPGKEAPETSRSFGGASRLRRPSLYHSAQQGAKHV